MLVNQHFWNTKNWKIKLTQFFCSKFLFAPKIPWSSPIWCLIQVRTKPGDVARDVGWLKGRQKKRLTFDEKIIEHMNMNMRFDWIWLVVLSVFYIVHHFFGPCKIWLILLLFQMAQNHQPGMNTMMNLFVFFRLRLRDPLDISATELKTQSCLVEMVSYDLFWKISPFGTYVAAMDKGLMTMNIKLCFRSFVCTQED